jgi:hypothetical protein
MITGAPTKSIPYVPEEERNATEKQTVFWIKPKTGHEANQSLAAYAGAGRDGRKGYRELNVRRLDNADVEQFLSMVEKVEWYSFSDRFPELQQQGPMSVIEGEVLLSKLAVDISSDLLIEVFEASNNMSQLMAGRKKESPSQPTSPSGSQSMQDDSRPMTATSA